MDTMRPRFVVRQDEFFFKDKVFLQEIMNDLHKNGFVPTGKADQMLKDWSRELREKTRVITPYSRLRRTIIDFVGWKV